MFNRPRAIFILGLCIIVLFSCDFLSETGNSGGMARVVIPLDDSDGSRAVGRPISGVYVTGYTVSIFGPGMQPVEKYVTRGAKSVDMYVPAGSDRHFTVEVHFTITDPVLFPYSHIRSFKAREIADLRPGRVTGLTMNLVAGATDLIVPDNRAMNIVSASAMTWSSPTTTSQPLTPTDIEIAADGRIFASSDYGKGALFSGTSTSSTFIPFGSSTVSPVALAMDRENGTLYYATSTRIYSTDATTYTTSPTYLMSTGTAAIASISGMAFDPWDNMLYIAGTITVSSVTLPALIKYNPAYTDGKSYGAIVGYVNQAACPNLRVTSDVTAKDFGIYVLNRPGIDTDKPYPSILKFDRNLSYISSYGTISKNASGMVASNNPGAFYYPQRFFAQENDGLFIIDDSALADPYSQDYDKLIFINEDLNPASWQTYPVSFGGKGETLETFRFFM